MVARAAGVVPTIPAALYAAMCQTVRAPRLLDFCTCQQLLKGLQMKIINKISDKLRHFFHLVSNVRPIVWIALYVALVPIFGFIYWLLPDGQFRVPDGGTTGYGSWVYYSIVTLTTLGFGDYTPCGAGSQAVTAIEVLSGLLVIGFFLNAVGAMRSEIDVESEIEKQRRVHAQTHLEKLQKNIPALMHTLNRFLAYCYAVTTPRAKRGTQHSYNEDFGEDDLAEMRLPAAIPGAPVSRTAIDGLLHSSSSTCLFLDSLQSRVDLELWPDLLDASFAFVANFQMLPETAPDESPHEELAHYIRANAALALKMETLLTAISTRKEPE